MMATLQARWLPVIAGVLALAQIAFLGSMIWGRAAILRDGAEVVLEVRPVDPRDLLRGDYVVVGYTISSIDRAIVTGPVPEGDGPHTLFVRLKAGASGLWEPVSASFDRPAALPPDGQVDIRGVVPYLYSGASGMSVDYGIERFYLPEGQGLEIEQGIGVRPFRMKVAVAADGSPQIKSFYDGDTMIFAEPLY